MPQAPAGFELCLEDTSVEETIGEDEGADCEGSEDSVYPCKQNQVPLGQQYGSPGSWHEGLLPPHAEERIDDVRDDAFEEIADIDFEEVFEEILEVDLEDVFEEILETDLEEAFDEILETDLEEAFDDFKDAGVEDTIEVCEPDEPVEPCEALEALDAFEA